MFNLLLKNIPKKYLFLVFLIFFLLIIQSLITVLLPFSIQNLIGIFETNQVINFNALLWQAAILLIIIFIILVNNAIISVLSALYSGYASYHLRDLVFKKVNTLSIEQIYKISIPSLISRTTDDIQVLSESIAGIVNNVLSGFFNLCFGFVTLFLICFGFRLDVGQIQNGFSHIFIKINEPKYYLIVLLIVITCFLVICYLIICWKIIIPKFKKERTLFDEIADKSREMITGVTLIRAYNGYDQLNEKFAQINEDYYKTTLRAQKWVRSIWSWCTSLMQTVIIAIYWLGASIIMQNYQKNFDGINISDIVAATTLANSLVIIFLLAAFSISELPNVLNCSKRIQEVLQINNQIMVIGPPITKFALTGDIQMTNVKFAFSEQLVLQDISFHIKKGQTLAIIGQNGSGKSTIINLLMRFFDVNDGRILIDGADIKQIPLKILRQKIGLVSQKTFLFTGKIADNIGFGVNESQKKNLVSETARHASASQFIEHLPDKYDYQVSQNSTNLSGGQKQRIAIARALSINPEILLFDDSFSALDLKTDFLVREKLQDKYHSTTKIIVAQRIGTIINADQIIVLDRGKIVAKGTHSQLLKKSKIYKDLAASQHIYA